MRVGPESSRANPGPVCYGYGGFLSITDANLVLGRLNADYFPKIFGKDNNQKLDYELTKMKFQEITKTDRTRIASTNRSLSLVINPNSLK